MDGSKSRDLLLRHKDFSKAIILFIKKLPKPLEVKVICNQLIRSGTSSGANYRAARRAKSRADFIYKLKIVEEELDESVFWLEILESTQPNLGTQIIPLLKEAKELLSITVASIKKIRSRT